MHTYGMQEVRGSTPLSSTSQKPQLGTSYGFLLALSVFLLLEDWASRGDAANGQ